MLWKNRLLIKKWRNEAWQKDEARQCYLFTSYFTYSSFFLLWNKILVIYFRTLWHTSVPYARISLNKFDTVILKKLKVMVLSWYKIILCFSISARCQVSATISVCFLDHLRCSSLKSIQFFLLASDNIQNSCSQKFLLSEIQNWYSNYGNRRDRFIVTALNIVFLEVVTKLNSKSFWDCFIIWVIFGCSQTLFRNFSYSWPNTLLHFCKLVLLVLFFLFSIASYFQNF